MIWAATNHIDKYLLNRFFKSGSSGPLVVMSALSSFLVFPLIWVFLSNKIMIGIAPIIIMLVCGIISALTCFLYLKALSQDEPSVVVPMFQLISVFNYFLGLIFLNEHLTITQIIACSFIILGAVGITLDLSDKKFRLKKGVFWIMFFDCLILAFYDLFFKHVVINTNYWGAMFWQYVSFALVGIFILIFNKNIRQSFKAIFKENKIPIIGLNLFNEIVNIIAVFIFNYALILMPIALVSVVGNGLQPFFVFVFGVIITLFFPKFGQESIGKNHLLQRIIAIVIIFIGSYLLNK